MYTKCRLGGGKILSEISGWCFVDLYLFNSYRIYVYIKYYIYIILFLFSVGFCPISVLVLPESIKNRHLGEWANVGNQDTAWASISMSAASYQPPCFWQE